MFALKSLCCMSPTNQGKSNKPVSIGIMEEKQPSYSKLHKLRNEVLGDVDGKLVEGGLMSVIGSINRESGKPTLLLTDAKSQN